MPGPVSGADPRLCALRPCAHLLVVLVLLCGAPPRARAQAHDAAARASEAAAAMQAGRFEAAAAIYDELVTSRPNDAGLLMNLGMARYMGGHPDQALPVLQKAVRLDESLAPASLFLGASLLDLGKFAKAAAPLQRAVALMPKNPDAREMLARSYLGSSQPSKAAPQYRTLTTLQPLNPKAWYGLARSYEGIAEASFVVLQKEFPDSPLLELIVADIAVTQEKYPAALAIYRRALRNDVPVGGLHQSVADLYERAGKSEWAAIELRQVKPRTAAYCSTRTAECRFLDGKFREALSAAQQSTTAVARFWTVRAANRLAVEAVTHLETLPSSVELHLIRAEIAQSRHRYPDGVAEVREALKLAPGNPAIESALAEALLQAHDLDEAIPLLERLTHAQPDDASLLLMYGDALLQGQQVDRAIPVLERAATAERALPSARALLGRAYVQAGRYSDAVPYLEASIENDQDGEIHYQLARAYQALDRQDDARKAMTEYQKRRQAAAPPPSEVAEDPVLTPPE
jgi:predicted Zn-dependent protease